MDVYAGLTPLDNRVLSLAKAAELTLYFQTQTASLLDNGKYATSFPLGDCNGGCRSIFLPGGIEIARLALMELNHTLFDGNQFDNAETISIFQAPGTLLTFQNLESDFPFNRILDCVYAGQMINDTLQLCVRQVDDSIAVGKSLHRLRHLKNTCKLISTTKPGLPVPNTSTTPTPVSLIRPGSPPP